MIRNHENRERAGEIKVVTGPGHEYDELALGGNTKLEVRRMKAGRDPVSRHRLETTGLRDFAILGGTSTNCAGGTRARHQWLTCEEVMKRSGERPKHGYIFEIDSRADGPVQAIPVTQAGRRAHEAALEHAGLIYMTEDRRSPDPLVGGQIGVVGRQIGAAFYRYIPRPRGGGVPLYATWGRLEALAVRGEPNKDMDLTTVVGVPYRVEWVPILEPDHDDDTDNRRDRMPGLTPNRVQAKDAGAAIFSRQEGMWTGPGSGRHGERCYFDCTTGGRCRAGAGVGYHPGRERLTLIDRVQALHA